MFLNHLIYQNPPFEIVNVTIPFGSSFATAFLSPQQNIIYLFGGQVKETNNTGQDDFKSVLHSYNLGTNKWTIPTTNGIIPVRKQNINGVINNETGKFFVFGGYDQYNITNVMDIFDTISLTWTKGSTINAPLPRVDYTATLLSNGIIVFIGGYIKTISVMLT
jgi:hypothetical protein